MTVMVNAEVNTRSLHNTGYNHHYHHNVTTVVTAKDCDVNVLRQLRTITNMHQQQQQSTS